MKLGRNTNSNALPSRGANASVASLPLSGSEITYTDLTYGSPRGVGNNNCYAYAIDKYTNSGNRKLQPGNISQSPGKLDLGSCAGLKARALADLKDRAYVADPDKPCQAGYYKIMSFLDKDNDYHWYKQHKDALVRLTPKMRDLAALARAMGVKPSQVHSPTASPKAGDLVLVKDAKVWSHKQGHATGPLLKDACGKAIRDPRKACRDYGRLNYREYCGALCVKK